MTLARQSTSSLESQALGMGVFWLPTLHYIFLFIVRHFLYFCCTLFVIIRPAAARKFFEEGVKTLDGLFIIYLSIYHSCTLSAILWQSSWCLFLSRFSFFWMSWGVCVLPLDLRKIEHKLNHHQQIGLKWVDFLYLSNTHRWHVWIGMLSDLSVLFKMFCSLVQVLWGLWETYSSNRDEKDGGEWQDSSSHFSFTWEWDIMTEKAECVTFLCCFFVVQALILKELDIVDPEYIGTICGSYRRGKISKM